MIKTDVVIVGAGPCGLFQVFELGLLGISAHVVEALPYAGGQCIQLYPDKPIYDIPAIPEISARGLVENLMAQIAPFNPEFHFEQRVARIEPQGGGRFLLETDNGLQFDTATVVIATGAGAIRPIRLKVDGIDRFEDSQLFYAVTDETRHHGKRLVILGGGDSALDWVMRLHPEAESVVLIHRSDRFRAQSHTVEKMHALCDDHHMQFLTGRVVDYVQRDGEMVGLKVMSMDGVMRRLEMDHLLVFFGLSPDSGTLDSWGIETERNQAKVDTEKFMTNRAGIYSIGDCNWYPGKKKLILSGFHEAALAAFAIKARLNPDEKVYLQYTTTSPALHERLGVSPDLSDLL